MDFDAITLRCILEELQRELAGGLIRQVYQGRPEPDLEPELEWLTLHFWLKGRGERVLFIGLTPKPRLHLTEVELPHPAQPPSFAMLLRKHLKGGTLQAMDQPGLERLVYLRVRRGEGEYALALELFGQGNAVLLRQGETQEREILGALRPRPKGSERALLPHRSYQPPPPQGQGQGKGKGKLPLEDLPLSPAGFERLLAEAGEQSCWQLIQRGIEGLSPRFAREVALRAGVDPEKAAPALTPEERAGLFAQLRELAAAIAASRWEPVIYYASDADAQAQAQGQGQAQAQGGGQGQPVDCAPFPLKLYELQGLRGERRASLSLACDELLRWELEGGRLLRRREGLLREVRRALKRAERALERVQEDLAKARDHERYRRMGDLILANLALLERGQREAELPDPEGGPPERVALDPRLSPVENAQRLYERSKKLKRALGKLQARRAELEEELAYLEEAERLLEEAETPQELEELELELAAEGYLQLRLQREQEGARRERGRERSKPREFLIGGYRVLVGRSGRQNDRLIREAGREDLWLHARGLPGAHVVIKAQGRRGEVPQEVLRKAAELAAYYSKGRGSSKVEVTYTKVKYLRKPKGARPGAVLISHEEGTLLVAPQAAELLGGKNKLMKLR